MSSDNKILVLKDNRKLSYSDLGNKEGFPVIFFHGVPGSRYELMHIIPENYSAARIISIDRAGYGNSTFKNFKSFNDFVQDVVELLNHLKIKKCSLAGVSGGGAFALAAAAFLDAHVHKVTIFNAAPLYPENFNELSTGHKITFSLCRLFPFLMYFNTELSRKYTLKNPDLMIARMTEILCDSDNDIFLEKQFANNFLIDINEGFNQNGKAAARDTLLNIRHWNICYDKISSPVKLIHGEKDRLIPLSCAKKLHTEIANSKLDIYEDEGHFLIYKIFLQEVQELIS